MSDRDGHHLRLSRCNTQYAHPRPGPARGQASGLAGPLEHDLRHTFAVTTLLGWYREGADVAGLLPRLSTYLGHSNPANTYWYLTAVPELLAHAARMLNIAQQTTREART